MEAARQRLLTRKATLKLDDATAILDPMRVPIEFGVPVIL
jgi:hypothetical protein